MKKREYFHPDCTDPILIDDLRSRDKDFQIEVMRNWFESKYENPAENTPYESSEGGYIYIWGGPYDAREELQKEFSNIISDEVIEELSLGLESLCHEWTGIPSEEQ